MFQFLMANPGMVQAFGTGLSVFSSLQKGGIGKSQARFDQQQLKIQMEQNKLATLERMNDRNEQWLANEKINRAYTFSKLGRDPSDRSFKAFQQKNRELAAQDTDRLQTQHAQTMGKLKMEVQMSRMAEKNAYTGALLGAGSAVASGLFRYQVYKSDMDGE
jgi:hypothetical protein